MNYQTIRYEQAEHVGTLTLARPEKLNAQNPLMWDELTELGLLFERTTTFDVW